SCAPSIARFLVRRCVVANRLDRVARAIALERPLGLQLGESPAPVAILREMKRHAVLPRQPHRLVAIRLLGDRPRHRAEPLAKSLHQLALFRHAREVALGVAGGRRLEPRQRLRLLALGILRLDDGALQPLLLVGLLDVPLGLLRQALPEFARVARRHRLLQPLKSLVRRLRSLPAPAKHQDGGENQSHAAHSTGELRGRRGVQYARFSRPSMPPDDKDEIDEELARLPAPKRRRNPLLAGAGIVLALVIGWHERADVRYAFRGGTPIELGLASQPSGQLADDT